jgi:3',5'-cyclic AMP phosphodiesterase CpdA
VCEPSESSSERTVRRGDVGSGARIVQLSDPHLSARAGVPDVWPAVLQWLRADPPDLIVLSGDLVEIDPDDAADRAFAHDVLTSVPAPTVAIPGNHDVGFYGEEDQLPARVAAFVATWGADHFERDLAGWRVVGIDAYRLGEPEHDGWFARAIATAAPVLVFVHQPVGGDGDDEWVMAPAARAAFARAVADADVRVVASGHRHRSHRDERAVWAPSLTLTGPEDELPGDPRPGCLEHRLGPDGGYDVTVVRPWLNA